MTRDDGESQDILRLLNLARAGAGPALGQLLERYRSYLSLLARVPIGRRMQGKLDVLGVSGLPSDRRAELSQRPGIAARAGRAARRCDGRVARRLSRGDHPPPARGSELLPGGPADGAYRRQCE